jgi:hypothetical protein
MTQTSSRCTPSSTVRCVPADYPQEGVDAAMAEFAALAGEENAAIIRPYVAAVLSRSGASADVLKVDSSISTTDSHQEHAVPPPAETSSKSTAVGATDNGTVQPPAAALSEPATMPATSGVTIDETCATETATAVAPQPSAADGELVPGGKGAALDSVVSKSETTTRRWPQHVTLHPILEKERRTAVHKFFREEIRIPVFRTETAQERKTKNGVVLISPSLPFLSAHICHSHL